MTVTITIEAHPDRGSLRNQIDESMQALGFKREMLSTSALTGPQYAPEADLPKAAQEAKVETLPADPTAPAAARERGKPAPGRSRRTKEEIAEDEAAQATTDKPQISTGENRVGPEDDAETQAQDAADEAAESAAAKGGKLTYEDIRAALGKLAKVVGIANAQQDLQKLLGGAISDVPDTQEAIGAAVAKLEAATRRGPVRLALESYAKAYGVEALKADGMTLLGVAKISDLPDDEAVLAKVEAEIKAAIDSNPFGRAKVA
jgi:hypothetical protein